MAASAPAEPPRDRRRVLVIGGGFAGLAAARDLRSQFRVTVVDAKEYFEFTPGILRAYCKPGHWDSLIFVYHEVLERRFGIGFIWGEVTRLEPAAKCAHVKTMFAEEEDIVPYDFCLVTCGCNFNQYSPTGESPWSPTVQGQDRPDSEFRHLDERFLEGRRRRILEEHHSLQYLNDRHAKVLVVGAGYMGVEWACELRHFFPGICVTITDFLPRCLGPLPQDASAYCEEYMRSLGVETVYSVKYDKDSPAYWERVRLPNGADKTYVLSGVKSSSHFMPKEVKSDKGPGSGGWITVNRYLQVVKRQGEKWGEGVVFAFGDCMAYYAKTASEAPAAQRDAPPVPKTAYSAEQQAVHACRNIRALDHQRYGGSLRLAGCLPLPAALFPGAAKLRSTWYPWGAGIFAISLGPEDGCVVLGLDGSRDSGRLWSHGLVAAAQKELIETTKVAQCRGDHHLSSFIWHWIHHCPVNLVGHGPTFSCLAP
uniref:FAD/NAD(P)-binding domain-containing protein n=1 Tax=Alexandrium monilatum TaxID=311494 RepID=A0A7S4S6Z1_9DINO